MTVKSEMIDKIRDFAARGLSAQKAADACATPDRPLTRAAILGMAHRHGIKFNAKRTGGKPYSKKPRPEKLKAPPRQSMAGRPVPRVVMNRPAPHVVVLKQPVAVHKPTPFNACAWDGCTRDSEEKDMFCAGHGRRSLME